MRGSFSPPLSSSSSFSARPAPRNVVTNLVVDGRAKAGEDGVRVKMYLKIALSAEHKTMSVIPLFPEESSLRIVDYAVHPLDGAGVPYAGGPKANALLKAASGALGIPAESDKSYLDAFVASPSAQYGRSSLYRSSPATNASPPAALEVSHTGAIQVAQYNICLLLPKFWPPTRGESESDDTYSRASTPSSTSRSRRSSVGGAGKLFRFMAGIEVWLPYLSMPPECPYLVSIPVPRCLQCRMKFKLPPPHKGFRANENDDVPRWDLTTNPVVQYKQSELHRPSIYGHVADDESFSDTSEANLQGEGGAVIIKGAFQSTDRLRIRWAQANDSESIPMDRLRRASCAKVEGTLKITILEVLRSSTRPTTYQGLRLALSYSATCRVVHPGVAARLALDVLLDTKGQTVTWPDSTSEYSGGIWQVHGGAGLVDFDAGGRAPTTPTSLSRRTSMSSFDSPSVPSSPIREDDGRPPRVRKSSIPVPAAASLLNVPLPHDAGHDYSFETAPVSPGRPLTSLSSSSMSAISDMTTSASGNEYTNAMGGRTTSPTLGIALHVDMDQMVPKSRQEGSVLRYTIDGVVDVQQQARLPADGTEALLDLPVFRMRDARDEDLQIQVVSNVADIVIIDRSSRATSSTLRMNSGRSKRALQLGVPVPCGEDAQLSIKLPTSSIAPPALRREGNSYMGSSAGAAFRPPESGADTGSMPLRMPRVALSSDKYESGLLTDVEDTGRSSVSPSVAGGSDIITQVHIIVEPLPSSVTQLRAHAVTVRIPAAYIDTSMLEFALKARSTAVDEKPLDVHLVYAALGGRQVDAKVLKGNRPEPGAVALSDAADATWIRVYLGGSSGLLADIEVVYIISTVGDSSTEDVHPVISAKGAMCVALLPTFYIRVGRLEVTVRRPQGYRIKSLQSNLGNQVAELPTSTTLTRYALPVSFAPQLAICLADEQRERAHKSACSLLTIVPILLGVFTLLLLFVQHAQIAELRAHLGSSDLTPLVQGAFVSQPQTPSRSVESHNRDPPHEHGLSILRSPHSLALQYPGIHTLLLNLSPRAAVETLHRMLTRALLLVQRILHYPLDV